MSVWFKDVKKVNVASSLKVDLKWTDFYAQGLIFSHSPGLFELDKNDGKHNGVLRLAYSIWENFQNILFFIFLTFYDCKVLFTY